MTLPSRHRIKKSGTWWSEVEHVTSRSQRLPTILNLYEWAGKELFVFLKSEFQWEGQTLDLRLSRQAPYPVHQDGGRYANGVHLSAVLENTVLVRGIRCEPLGQYFGQNVSFVYGTLCYFISLTYIVFFCLIYLFPHPSRTPVHIVWKGKK